MATKTATHSRKPSFRVECQECRKRFSTTKEIPYCPRCNSADVELIEVNQPAPATTAPATTAPATTDINTITEYGLTQRLSRSIRVF